MEDLWGDDFDLFYESCEVDDRLELKKTIDAKDLFKVFLKSVVETGMPYVFFRDTVNQLNPNKHAGMVYSSQLCTEIAQNMSAPEFVEEVDEDGMVSIKYKPGDSVVCNLASINMGKVFTDEEIQKVLPISMRLLDNVIEMNFFPFKESELTSKKYRSVGLGFL
jgi:ribonucleoside-diphosphate reductase alpha chain